MNSNETSEAAVELAGFFNSHIESRPKTTCTAYRHDSRGNSNNQTNGSFIRIKVQNDADKKRVLDNVSFMNRLVDISVQKGSLAP